MQLTPSLKGLTAEGSLPIVLSAAEATNPSLKGESGEGGEDISTSITIFNITTSFYKSIKDNPITNRVEDKSRHFTEKSQVINKCIKTCSAIVSSKENAN